jgi:hypothetical protein
MEQQVNLYQPILGAEKRLFSAGAIALGLALLVIFLGVIAGVAAWRTQRIEGSVKRVEQQEAAQMSLAANAGMLLHPVQTLAQLNVEARDISADIAARERALQIVRRGAAGPAAGFAAQLEALGRQQIDGIWLTRILLSSGASPLAMQGGTTDPKLLPEYLAALTAEHALDAVRFDRLSMRRAHPDEAPALIIFELLAPGLRFSSREPPR